ncbi:major facilitator superfamily transporter [Penicillium lividum]|nr:major facilitator superfamily transporter [Penicillium lividum]
MSSTSVASSERKDEKLVRSTWSGEQSVQGTPPSPTSLSSASSTESTSATTGKSVIGLMTLSAVQLLWGHLYKAFPAKLVFLSALGIFEIGCIVSATASSSAAVIVGRAVSGLGSAGFFCGCLI